MNDLDRKIAELKDVGPPTEKQMGSLVAIHGQMAPLYWIHNHRGPELNICEPVRVESLNWSTSDSKALELVDDLPHPTFFLERYGREKKEWRAVFDFKEFQVVTPAGVRWYTFDGKAPTRPEAICRAYIAAVTWMREKKG